MTDRRTLRVAIGTGLAVPALAILGEALAPEGWDPPRVPEEWAYRSLAELPAAETATPPSVGPIDREEIRIPVRDTVLEGTVVAPREPGRYPAVVFVHGAGPGPRSALIDQAEYLASVGVVTLVYDKRTVGYSFANRNFDLLAEDALAAVRVLRGRADVDPDRVGLWGVSEGGWVVPIAGAPSRGSAPRLPSGCEGDLPQPGEPDGRAQAISTAQRPGHVDLWGRGLVAPLGSSGQHRVRPGRA